MRFLTHELGRGIFRWFIAFLANNILCAVMQNSGSVNPMSGGHLGSAPSWNALGPSVGVTISKPQTPQTSSSGSMSLPHPGTLGSSGTIRQPNKEGKQHISQN